VSEEWKKIYKKYYREQPIK